ncbi:hypothetical protein KJ641_00535 [Patescibacteria group bacterium]|nr:hypothetical protein [Patescibacteria group bacterium]MBU1895345.1 hypothetical protein [Patescibacteria group bacterium]
MVVGQFKNFVNKFHENRRGAGALIFVLVFGTVSTVIIIVGVANYALAEHRASIIKHNRDAAFHIAEAGINYYRWHLAHSPEDFRDGEEYEGPYVHEYRDKDGNVIGIFSLEITPPSPGGTVAIVRSTGWKLSQPSSTRTIQIRVGYPALTDYVFVEDVNMSFSYTTEVHGKVHSNGGIEFNGTTDALVESAKETYYNDSYGFWKPGIWGGGGPVELWNFPVPENNFDSISADLSALSDLAEDGGIYLNSSGVSGYHIVFLANGTFDLYKVTGLLCYYGEPYQKGWRWYWDVLCYDISSETFLNNYNIPENGAIFANDHVWVDGVVDGRVTLGAGRFPANQSHYKSIYISNNLTYETKNSDDVLGLIAQGDVIVPLVVPDDMEIDAAALSQFGKIKRPYYYEGYGTAIRNSLLFYGSQISRLGGGWKYTSGGSVIGGFINTNHTYDGNLRYLPPPGFPVGDTYELISWEEIIE